jgi:sulfur carrier protein ThiS
LRITIKLFAGLSQHLPEYASGNRAELDIAEGATPRDVIGQLGVAEEECHLVMLNGAHIDRAELSVRALASDDVLAIWPMVAGG